MNTVVTGQEYFMRAWIQPEADRLARLIHGSILTPQEAHHELRVTARRHASRGKLKLDADRFADRMLVDEWHRQEEAHAATFTQLSQLAVQILNRGGTLDGARLAIGDAALDCPLPPPEALLEQALHHATVEHRRRISWQRKREAMA